MPAAEVKQRIDKTLTKVRARREPQCQQWIQDLEAQREAGFHQSPAIPRRYGIIVSTLRAVPNKTTKKTKKTKFYQKSQMELASELCVIIERDLNLLIG